MSSSKRIGTANNVIVSGGLGRVFYVKFRDIWKLTCSFHRLEEVEGTV